MNRSIVALEGAGRRKGRKKEEEKNQRVNITVSTVYLNKWLSVCPVLLTPFSVVEFKLTYILIK